MGVDDCSGVFALQWGREFLGARELSVGDVVHLQFWMRDASAAPFRYGLSDALKVEVGP